MAENKETKEENLENTPVEEADLRKEEAGEAKEQKTDRKETRKKPDKKADAQKEKIAELEDKVQRQLAEFENFRRRTDKEKQQMFEVGAKSVIEKILPIVDNFERGLDSLPEDLEDPFADGMKMVYKQLMQELEAIDVKPIEALGKEFDPNLHNAVMQAEGTPEQSGLVAAELQKGYTYRDSVVRHSMVSVFN